MTESCEKERKLVLPFVGIKVYANIRLLNLIKLWVLPHMYEGPSVRHSQTGGNL